jgi:uncharacterized protein (DUF305 family)
MIAQKLNTAVLALAVSLSLAACSADKSDDAAKQDEPSATEHNAADVEFAQAMIPHHAQALAMVDMTIDRPLDKDVTQLTEDIRMAQSPEIETMTDWLVEWKEEVPETMRDHSNAGHDMEGMMSHEALQELADADDAAFQDLWLEMMIEHHEGAVEMAQTELDEGRYQPALDLAQAIIDGQNAEIETMRAKLDE